MKKRIDVIAGETAYKNLSSFTELEELNKTVRAYRDVIRASVKRADVQARLIKLLNHLKGHSCKYLGVSFMHKNNIAKKLDLSYKTIQRLMKKLENLGMIKQVAMKSVKNNMLQTCNAIIIIPFVKEEVSDKTATKTAKKCPTNKTKSISLKQKIKNIRNSNNNPQKVDNSVDNVVDNIVFYDYTYVSSNVPVTFIDSVRPFFGQASDIYRLWSRLKLAAKKSNVDVYDNLDSFIKTFKETIFNIKRNRNKKDVFGYIYGAWRNIGAVVARRENAGSFYNWFEN